MSNDRLAREWVNWSGSLRFQPGRIDRPEDETALANLVRRAANDKRTVRVVGAGHSSSPLVETSDVLVSLAKFQGLHAHDMSTRRATVGSGMTLQAAGEELLRVGLAVHNLGDVNVQSVAGAIATGTHGSGKTLANLSTLLVGGRVVTGTGDIVDFSLERDPALIRALRVSLGGIGILTRVQLQLLPAYRLHRQEWCTQIDDALAHLDQLVAENRNFDFYWYPRSDEAKLRALNSPEQASRALPYAQLVKEQTGWSTEVISKVRELKFDEMEYALPAEAGPACFREIRQRVKEKHRRTVGWRILYRTVAPDDAYLSPAFGRDTVTISLHQNAGLPFWGYFLDIEPILRAYGGRPHWGKKHTLRAPELRSLYPLWEEFLHWRQQFDPQGVFLNSYLRELLGVE